MANILGLGTAVPTYSATAEQIRSAAHRWLKDHRVQRELFDRFLAATKSDSRYLILPPDEILHLGGPSHRAQLFEHHAPKLAGQALHTALTMAKLHPEQIDTLIFTSCSVPVIPSVDALLVEALGLRSTINRIPIYQHGCAGGVIGLAIANRLIQPGKCVAVVSVELCSLIFYLDDLSPAHLVGTAIFGDGSACAIIAPEGEGLNFVGAQSLLIPNSRHLMGYDIRDNGSHLLLDKELPSTLASYTPEVVDDFLAQHNLVPADISWWLFHPGGIKILDCLEAAFHLDPTQAKWSRDVLSTYGNLSSSSVLFVMSEFLKSAVYHNGDYVLMVGVGPGLTLELILFRYHGPRRI